MPNKNSDLERVYCHQDIKKFIDLLRVVQGFKDNTETLRFIINKAGYDITKFNEEVESLLNR